jgi:RNA polymerase sigma factor (sigma-70 family)
MMEAVRVPPFEIFYEEHRDRVFRLLVRRLGRQRAEDAFQETFLRALRAYPSLDHASHLGAWVTTIAERVAIDVHRRRTLWDGAEIPELESLDERPGYEELRDLTADLPPKERAAVVLRYGYDLDYSQIGAAIGSSAEAARQAASSGVRRLRKKEPS